MEKVFKQARGNLSGEALWNFITTVFPSEMKLPLTFPIRLETRSNLWPSVAFENNAAMGLECKELRAHETQIKALVNRRNEIAHGKKLVVSTLTEYEVYEKAVLLVLHELAVAIVTHLSDRAYEKKSAEATNQLWLPFG